MSARDAFDRAMGRLDKTVACVPTISTYDMRKASGTRFPEAHRDGAKMARLAGAAERLYGLPSVRVPFDFTIEAEAMGWSVDLGDDGRYPSVIEEDRKPTPLDTSSPRCAALAEAMMLLGKGDAPVIVGATSPFTLLCSVQGIEQILMLTHVSPNLVKDALSPLTDGVSEFLVWAKDKADCLTVSESLMSPDILPSTTVEALVMPFLYPLFRDADIIHCCGDVTDHLPILAELQPRGISIESTVSPKSVREEMPETAIIGNVGAVDPLLTGSEMEVMRSAREALSSGVDILSPECGVAPGTPKANLRAIVKAIERQPP